MKNFLTFFLLVSIVGGCKPKLLTKTALQNKLIETMADHLHKTLNPGVTFTINQVIYYPDKNQNDFDCEFTVRMKYQGKDTTGIVAATISGDFKRVIRTQ
jgi:hypothetical protein